MESRSTSFVRTSITRLAIGLLISLAVGFLPQTAAAQCVTCGFDYAEETFECMDAQVGAHWCLFGLSYNFKEKEWESWCIGGGFCEWIVHLDFAEDGTAYTQRSSTPPVTDGWLVEPDTPLELPETCDGVPLGVRMAKMKNPFLHAPITLEI